MLNLSGKMQPQDGTPSGDAVHNAAMEVFGKKERPSQDWFMANLADMELVIEAKRIAMQVYKQSPSGKTQTALPNALQDDAPTITDSCCAATTAKKTAALKFASGETIVDQGEQMARWVEHYSLLYVKERPQSHRGC